MECRQPYNKFEIQLLSLVRIGIQGAMIYPLSRCVAYVEERTAV